LIASLDADYRTTIIARSARDYVWIMARTPALSDSDYARLVEAARVMGYDVNQLRRVPQRW
jgi:apolipoprotein D and lipocalin family protein